MLFSLCQTEETDATLFLGSCGSSENLLMMHTFLSPQQYESDA